MRRCLPVVLVLMAAAVAPRAVARQSTDASPIGRLDKALDEAAAHGWTVVDMKEDWKTVFPKH